ncbi:hypothetical protein M9H77_06860 [Catharanthus roseus]|uniref:Uncharacterized protein n=1 Tax=Catharanthus roseus TaxID=4058 RepID=A0ACC0BTB1_CATRO|nr:hypothetical protein M9H77_06860 [Catharanthus roseus]
MRHIWEIKVGDRIKDFLGDAQGVGKRPIWILEMYLEQMMKYWKSPEYKAFCKRNKRNMNAGRGGWGARKQIVDSTERFSKSRHLEELHKYKSGDKKGQYVDFYSEEFWKAKEEATATGVPLPNDLQLMATISSGLNRDWSYRASSEVAHLKTERSQATARLPPCCFEAKQRIMRWVEAVVSNICTTFDEHMRQCAKQSHFSYIPMPPMMDITRSYMATILLHYHRWQQLWGLQMQRGGIQYGRVIGIENCGKKLLHLNPSKTLMHTPFIILDDIVKCESFQAALHAQVQPMKDQQELNVMKEENDKLQMEEMRRIQEAQYRELCKRLRGKLMEIQSSSGGVRMKHHTVDGDDDDDDDDDDDQSEEE